MTTFFGIAGCVLLCLALIVRALRLETRTARVRSAALAAIIVLLLVPVDGLPVVGYVRGVTGDLSVTTLILAAGALWGRLAGRSVLERRELDALLGMVAGAALFLYPFALGWTPFDPYALGYGSPAFVTALLLAALGAWHAGLKLPVLVVLAGALAFLGGVYESRNLWDYLIDPLVSIYAIVLLAARPFRRRTLAP